MSIVIRIVIKILLSFVFLFLVGAIQMAGLPAFVCALILIAGLRAIITWKPSDSDELTIEKETLKKD